jgi:hypothetical protein
MKLQPTYRRTMTNKEEFRTNKLNIFLEPIKKPLVCMPKPCHTANRIDIHRDWETFFFLINRYFKKL